MGFGSFLSRKLSRHSSILLQLHWCHTCSAALTQTFPKLLLPLECSGCTHSHTNHKHKRPLGFSVPPSPWETLSSPWLLFLLQPRSWGCFPVLWGCFPALWSGFPALWSGFPSPVGSLGTAQLGNVFLKGDTHLSAMLLPPKGPPRLSETISCSSYRKETNPAMHHIGRKTHP